MSTYEGMMSNVKNSASWAMREKAEERLNELRSYSN